MPSEISTRQRVEFLLKEGRPKAEVAQILGITKSCVTWHSSANTRKYYLEKRAENKRRRLTDFKKRRGGKCENCGYDKCLDALQFHHKDPKLKEARVGSMIRWYSLARAEAEADKCQLLCANCHFELHSNLPDSSNAQDPKLRTL